MYRSIIRKFEQPTLKSCTLATVLTWRTHLSKTYIHLIVLTGFVPREISRTDYFHVLHVSTFTHILVPSGFESKYLTKSSTVIGFIARCIETKYMRACLRVDHTLENFGSYSTRRRNRARRETYDRDRRCREDMKKYFTTIDIELHHLGI